MEIVKCSNCGEIHDKLPAIGFIVPYHYKVLSEEDKEHIAKISEDFCLIRHEIQTDRFIRAVLVIETIDACENLEYGVWVSLSKKSFEDYASTFNKEVESRTYFGTICNEIADYEASTLGLHVNVSTRNGRARPQIVLQEGSHQLIKDFLDGISIAEVEQRLTKIIGQ